MARVSKAGPESIAQAVDILRRGGVVAFPTETVYGLGADTFNAQAIERIYALKGRPADNPLIAHVLGAEQARGLASHWDNRAERLAAMFWPGPLTIVLPKADDVPGAATAGLPTVAVRAPSHPVARELLAGLGKPISAPSANRSGRVSPTRAAHVAEDFADVPDLLILDSGPSHVGIESTVLDLSGAVARVLRPGRITVEQLRQALGEVESPHIGTQGASPGTAISHYSPRTPAELISRDELRARCNDSSAKLAILCLEPSIGLPRHVSIVMPNDADEYAKRLYEALREADAAHASRILIERPTSESGVWRAVLDRLTRATAR